MSLPITRVFGLLTASALLSSCGEAINEALFPHNLPHHVAFDEAAFTGTLRSGTGVVQGQLAANFRDGTTYYPPDTKVGLVPVNAYTSEIIQRKYINGAYLAKPDPRYAKYVRIAVTDDQGRFSFSKVPPGEYYVGSKVSYTTTWTYTDDNGFSETEPETHIWRDYARITLQPGQKITITDWSTGPERITNP